MQTSPTYYCKVASKINTGNVCWVNIQTDRHAGKKTDRYNGRQTDTPSYRHKYRPTDRHAGIQTHRKIDTPTFCLSAGVSVCLCVPVCLFGPINLMLRFHMPHIRKVGKLRTLCQLLSLSPAIPSFERGVGSCLRI